ncbi:MAG: histidine phosphatase family protein [Micropepsaceae bacterium]
MARLYLVRHGEPTGSWGSSPDPDPGLSELGQHQARIAADRLRLLTPRQIVTSPLRRAAQTARPLTEVLSLPAQEARPVAEIPTPATVSVERRGEWLKAVMARTWDDVEPELVEWRNAAIDFLLKLDTDTAVFSHYVLINVAVGAAIGDDRVHCFAPSHASVTILETNGRVLSLVEIGATGASAIK